MAAEASTDKEIGKETGKGSGKDISKLQARVADLVSFLNQPRQGSVKATAPPTENRTQREGGNVHAKKACEVEREQHAPQPSDAPERGAQTSTVQANADRNPARSMSRTTQAQGGRTCADRSPARSRSRNRPRRREQRKLMKQIAAPTAAPGSTPAGADAWSYYGYYMHPYAYAHCGAYYNSGTMVAQQSLPSRPSAPPSGGGSRHPTRPCKFFRDGFCKHGDTCQYAHDAPAKDAPTEVPTDVGSAPSPSASSTAPPERSERRSRWGREPKEVGELALAKIVPETMLCEFPVPIRVDVQGQGLASERRFRAIHIREVEPSEGKDCNKSAVVGPWRIQREDALMDADIMRDAHGRKGMDEMAAEAVSLHRKSCTQVPDDVRRWELQEKSLPAGHTQHRCLCYVDAMPGVLSQEPTASRSTRSFASAWRASRLRAEEDLWSLFVAYRTGGFDNVQRLIANQQSAMRLPGLL